MAKDMLLEAIRGRSNKKTPFSYGITTADRYVSTLADYIGPDACNRMVRRSRGSFDDLLKQASRTLVYSNEGMVVEEIGTEGIELPKNCLMAFRHVLTDSTKDRDGDTLHSDGAQVDPKMLLLWQHVHTLPIGKLLVVDSQNAKRLKVVSCIVDMNQLCHDAAVMVDNDMGRFSHGFRALEFTETKARDGHSAGGFDVTKFEVMEESLVSVPANTSAETEEVILSLVEGGKLSSPLMKRVGRGIREKRAIQIPGVSIKYRERLGDFSKELTCNSLADLKTAAEAGLIGGQKDENVTGDRGEKGEGQDGTGASKETDDKAADKIPESEGTDNAEVSCPECEWTGPMTEDGKCPECGADLKQSVEEDTEKAIEIDEEKAVEDAKPDCEFDNEKRGRVLNGSNEKRIKDAMDCHKEVFKLGESHTSPSARALVKEAHGHLDTVVKSLGDIADAATEVADIDVKTAMTVFLTKADTGQRNRMINVLKALDAAEQPDPLVEQYRTLLGSV